jgi:hypothetical protein
MVTDKEPCMCSESKDMFKIEQFSHTHTHTLNVPLQTGQLLETRMHLPVFFVFSLCPTPIGDDVIPLANRAPTRLSALARTVDCSADIHGTAVTTTETIGILCKTVFSTFDAEFYLA